jgi:hypothetical protein
VKFEEGEQQPTKGRRRPADGREAAKMAGLRVGVRMRAIGKEEAAAAVQSSCEELNGEGVREWSSEES